MPIYQYRCQACSHLQEALQKMSDPPLKECEACGGELKKIIAPAGIIFKGSGWHVTDYSRSSGSAEKPGKDESKSDKPADTASGDNKESSSPSPSPSQPSTDSGTPSSQKVA